MSASAGVMEKLDFHLKLAKKCMDEVQELSSRKFNDGQCDYLVHKLDMAIQSASLFLEDSQVQFNGLHRFMHSARQVEIFELLVASAKQVKSFVRRCSRDTWMHSAVTSANVAAYISWLGFNMELCKIALKYGQASLESLTIDEVSKIHEDEVEVVKERASRDANILLKKVTLELNTPYSSENCKLAKYLLHLLVGVDPKPGFDDDDNNPFWGFFDWVVPRKKDRKIGSSATATVYKEEWLGIRVAKKTFYGPKNGNFLKEVEILSQLRHPNITSMFCCHTSKLSCSIIMELMSGDLCHMIRRRRERNGDAPPFTVMEGIDLMLQVGEGVNYLHEKRIVHRDLKSSNILVKYVEVSGLELGYVQAKVADFGISKTKEHSMSYSTTSLSTGTCRWMAPEVINTYQENPVGSRAAFVKSPKYVFKVDIYSFAMVCYEVLSGEVPFQSEGRLSKVKEKVLKGERPILPVYCPMILKSLIEKCWSQNPSERPRIGDVCKQLKYIKYLWMTNREDFMVSSTSMLEIVQAKTDLVFPTSQKSFVFRSDDPSTSGKPSAPSYPLYEYQEHEYQEHEYQEHEYQEHEYQEYEYQEYEYQGYEYGSTKSGDEQMMMSEQAQWKSRPSPRTARTAASVSRQLRNAQEMWALGPEYFLEGETPRHTPAWTESDPQYQQHRQQVQEAMLQQQLGGLNIRGTTKRGDATAAGHGVAERAKYLAMPQQKVMDYLPRRPMMPAGPTHGPPLANQFIQQRPQSKAVRIVDPSIHKELILQPIIRKRESPKMMAPSVSSELLSTSPVAVGTIPDIPVRGVIDNFGANATPLEMNSPIKEAAELKRKAAQPKRK